MVLIMDKQLHPLRAPDTSGSVLLNLRPATRRQSMHRRRLQHAPVTKERHVQKSRHVYHVVL